MDIHSTECVNNNVLGASIISTGDKHTAPGPGATGYCDINVPVYATVKGVRDTFNGTEYSIGRSSDLCLPKAAFSK